MDSIEKNINILSFDGGGSKGFMELKILDDILRLATIVLRNPKTLNYLVNKHNDESEVNFLEDRDVRERLINDLRKVEDPIHPTDVYDMIVGTSTGGLIAFGLVGGNKVGDNHHERKRMTVEECIEMYRSKTKMILERSWNKSTSLFKYSKDNVKKSLEEQFNECSLSDIREKGSPKCVAGAVARRLSQSEGMVLFDTASEDYKNHKACEVLLATSNAPIYFDTPVKIGNDEFVDGGVGANCPLAQAIPRAMKIFGDDGKHVKIFSVLSIAPPLSTKGPSDDSSSLHWLCYLFHLCTNGNAVYNDVVAQYRRNKTLFQRFSPRGKKLKKIKLDETNIRKMEKKMEKAKSKDDMFLVDVVAAAMVVVLAYISKNSSGATGNIQENYLTLKAAAPLAEAAGCAYESRKELNWANVSYETSRSLHEKHDNNLSVIKINYKIAKCQKELGNYEIAIDLFKSNVKHLVHHQDDPNCLKLLVDAMLSIAECCTTCLRYVEAETYLHDVLEKHIKEKKKFVRVIIYVAWFKQQQGKLDEAFKLYWEASKCPVDSNSLDEAQMLIILSNQGLCLLTLGINEKNLIRQAKDVRKKMKQESDPLVAESLNYFGSFLMKKEEYDDAYENLIKAKAIYERQKITDELKFAMVLTNLASCPSSQQSPQVALSRAQEALEQMKKKSCIITVLKSPMPCQFLVGAFLKPDIKKQRNAS
ncbi:uncharacterized protein LOC124434461 isoform X2 [Xenia sp. Carnegie-2017]|nr:uncharacterized protein LOC124434461 isoform X2 [Xenia sp. Carnegie-2017]XP_046840319.1 uncharacterized protein LOC124434461 isoform X2 [Xenia sp. Carnegie-2017]XP_046840320.1 uncharacterized protein LOC124434461 isoform X2 [Xenia sp. Carnegie-2017]